MVSLIDCLMLHQSFNDDYSSPKISQSDSVKARSIFPRRWNALREPSKGTYGNTFN